MAKFIKILNFALANKVSWIISFILTLFIIVGIIFLVQDQSATPVIYSIQ